MKREKRDEHVVLSKYHTSFLYSIIFQAESAALVQTALEAKKQGATQALSRARAALCAHTLIYIYFPPLSFQRLTRLSASEQESKSKSKSKEDKAKS